LDEDDDEGQSNFAAAPVLTPKAEDQQSADTDLSQASSSGTLDAGQFALAEDETKMTICELLECLSLDDLKKFAKQMKLKLNGNVCLFIIPSLALII
jgi:hypothetical protein